MTYSHPNIAGQDTVRNSTKHQPHELRERIRFFVQEYVNPVAHEIDSRQAVTDDLLAKLVHHGFFGANIPEQYGGHNFSSDELGVLHEEFGKGHASIENILTVIGMASKAILKGSQAMKEKWLPRIVNGQVLPVFALTEPRAGSNIQSIETSYTPTKGGYVINGVKKWITLGAKGDIFVVFATNNGVSSAFIMESDRSGVEVIPIRDMLGFRGNMLAELQFQGCYVPKSHLIGREGAGLNIVAAMSLNEGRYFTAWGAVGLAHGALARTVSYLKKRKQFDRLLKDHDLVKQAVAKMLVSVEASRQLCYRAGFLREQGMPEQFKAILIAKYHASKTATAVSERAVQLLGAYGCHQEGGVERYFRDAKIMELIEGASEVLELQIADLLYLEEPDAAM